MLLTVDCLPNAVGKQPSIPLIYLGRKWTLNWWWWWWWWHHIVLFAEYLIEAMIVSQAYARRPDRNLKAGDKGDILNLLHEKQRRHERMMRGTSVISPLATPFISRANSLGMEIKSLSQYKLHLSIVIIFVFWGCKPRWQSFVGWLLLPQHLSLSLSLVCQLPPFGSRAWA